MVKFQIVETFHLKMNIMVSREGNIQFKVSQIYNSQVGIGVLYLSCGIELVGYLFGLVIIRCVITDALVF